MSSGAEEGEKQLRRCETTSTCEPSDISPCDLEVPRDTSHCALSPAAAQLSCFFPGFEFETWRTCRLIVDADTGSGITLEATPYGYLIDMVEKSPGQESAFQVGMVIVSIGTCSLIAYEEEELESTFGKHFRDGTWVHLLEWSEVCSAKIGYEAAVLGEWHEEGEVQEQAALVPVASPFLREQEGLAELIVMLSGELSDAEHQKFLQDLAGLASGLVPPPQLYFQWDNTIKIHGDMTCIRPVLKKLETLVRQFDLKPLVEDELFIKMLQDDERSLLIEDLWILGQRHCIITEMCCPPQADDSIILCGDVAHVREAIAELEDILSFHCVVRVSSAGLPRPNESGAEDMMHEAEDLEIEGQGRDGVPEHDQDAADTLHEANNSEIVVKKRDAVHSSRSHANSMPMYIA